MLLEVCIYVVIVRIKCIIHMRVYSLFFGEDISALSYISWEREIDDLLHSFHIKHSKYHILTLCISSFVGHAREWWDYRQSRVKKGRKFPIQNWSELRACMRRTFIPPSFDFDHEIEKKKI